MMRQLPLFPTAVPEQPQDALTLLKNGAALALSVSGGRDSDAMCHHLLDLRQAEGWPGECLA
jgi:hypothetical protein